MRGDRRPDRLETAAKWAAIVMGVAATIYLVVTSLVLLPL